MNKRIKKKIAKRKMETDTKVFIEMMFHLKMQAEAVAQGFRDHMAIFY